MRKNLATSGWRAAGYRSVSPVIFKTLAVLFSGLEAGSIRVVLPGGHAHTFAGRRPGPAAELHIHTSNFVWRTLRRGTIGFAEGYFRDECDTPDLG
ncbi:MAG: SAM-dependent methyltransferase, partial [Pseudomonadota bacterium]